MTLSACTPLTESNLYQSWERQAYKVYQKPKASLVSQQYASLKQKNSYVYMPEKGVVSQPKTQTHRLSQQEKQYIADFYGL